MKRVITEADVQRFRYHLGEEERSDSTIRKYTRDVRHFLDFTGDSEITKDKVLEYKDRLKSDFATRSVNSMLAALNSFFVFMGWGDLKVKALKIQQEIFCPKSRELSEDDYRRMVSKAYENGDEKVAVMFQTICATGIRVSELEYITKEAVLEGCAVVNCKGKIRQVIIPKRLQDLLLRYCDEKGIESGSIFLTKKGKVIDRSNIWRIMKNNAKQAGVDEGKVFPHNFRHLFARTFYEHDKDIAKLADVLGHSSINTTRIYITSSGDEHRKVIDEMGLV
jgi:site-specific recombinase XerD